MIIRKTPREIEIMRHAGKIVALAHDKMKESVKPGITTNELDQIAEKFIRSMDATPSFKGYNGFSGSICVSVNEELVHGIPSDRKLNDGDIISIDIGANYSGYHGDSAWTYAVGEIDEETQRLLDVTETSLFKGLDAVKPGNRLTDISYAIQSYVDPTGFTIVQEYGGHGIGQNLHEDPHISNFGPPNKGPRLKEGMVLAIEPMINAGERFVRTLDDNWTVVTEDGKYCAHFEHTVVVTAEGYEILTKA
ncbi:type I methionyl aminopeptidase [Halalkalibacillus halophilus]|uniref:type I methionyl aminopeptidase n=1 Tax=Halalkalibacillus halophilus TaxID=392827 RepID=UPI000425A215|nr:type I methionyl aminopeptidase [Halalkalibacillus halophilus]